MAKTASQRAYLWALLFELLGAVSYPITIWMWNPHLAGGETAFGSVLMGLFINGTLVGLGAVVAAALTFPAMPHRTLPIRITLAIAAPVAGAILLLLTADIFVNRIMGW